MQQCKHAPKLAHGVESAPAWAGRPNRDFPLVPDHSLSGLPDFPRDSLWPQLLGDHDSDFCLLHLTDALISTSGSWNRFITLFKSPRLGHLKVYCCTKKTHQRFFTICHIHSLEWRVKTSLSDYRPSTGYFLLTPYHTHSNRHFSPPVCSNCNPPPPRPLTLLSAKPTETAREEQPNTEHNHWGRSRGSLATTSTCWQRPASSHDSFLGDVRAVHFWLLNLYYLWKTNYS